MPTSPRPRYPKIRQSAWLTAQQGSGFRARSPGMMSASRSKRENVECFQHDCDQGCGAVVVVADRMLLMLQCPTEAFWLLLLPLA